MVWLALALVFGVVIGNLLLLKHTANMKMPSLNKRRHADDDSDGDPPENKSD
ncbi:DUF2897 family protein [Pseudidiomarina salinarum]|uniref:DUF2897 family protein n=1 Tax=Pseudidiomarina salinarum TaxID=435908 RepID=UPI000A04230D|nr:DUF2897 family protein [Pseudidiomarina salinarum]RUO70196.1 DUF2897 domain-containing protein [Pseudidiomarina salinarum]